MRRSASTSSLLGARQIRALFFELDAVVGHRRLELRDPRRGDEAVVQQLAVGLQLDLLVT